MVEINYKLTYMVDGEEYKSYQIAEGSAITPEAAPTKDGYVFSGWTKIPATMPAEDVTITGTFTLLTDEDVIQITSAGQSTWCSKYDLDFTGVEGLKAYTATGYDRISGTIWLTRVYQVPANEGIFLMGNADEYHVPHKSTGTYYANLMVGTLQPITIYETDGEYTNYYLSNGDSGVGFYKVNGSVDLKANRAYLFRQVLVLLALNSKTMVRRALRVSPQPFPKARENGTPSRASALLSLARAFTSTMVKRS